MKVMKEKTVNKLEKVLHKEYSVQGDSRLSLCFFVKTIFSKDNLAYGLYKK